MLFLCFFFLSLSINTSGLAYRLLLVLLKLGKVNNQEVEAHLLYLVSSHSCRRMLQCFVVHI